MSDNLILDTDSYKVSMNQQYPPGTEIVSSYIEARKTDPRLMYDDKVMMFGLQPILRRMEAGFDLGDVRDAIATLKEHGVPFDHVAWMRLFDKHGGRLPLQIFAKPEGSWHEVGTPLVRVENTDTEFFWLTTWFETMLMRMWYPTTVATLSAGIKQRLTDFWKRTSDAPQDSLLFKLHDFGSRGVSSSESASIGGAAHLVSFLGTDTITALPFIRREYYGPLAAGYSIPAAEHSTITSWGKENEADAYRNMLIKFAKPGSVVAVVSDSYDVFNACDKIWGGELREEVVKSGATVVIRPDSGDPVGVVSKCLDILSTKFGYTTNSRGYRVLNNVRLIQGDGVNPVSIHTILANMSARGYSIDNIAFGMGGALLQKVDRDTLGFAMKCSAIRRNGEWQDVFKDPITDSGKKSKRGRIPLDGMRLVFEDGDLCDPISFSEVRANSNG